MNRRIVLIAHNIRSCHNVGSLLRTAEGLGVGTVYLTGYTPYPSHPKDTRLPHTAAKIERQIHKTALGAEKTMQWEHYESVQTLISHLKDDGFQLCALEQTKQSQPLPNYHPPSNVALLVGREVEGIELAILRIVDKVVEIPMIGKKESFNVAQAAAMALYHVRFIA